MREPFDAAEATEGWTSRKDGLDGDDAGMQARWTGITSSSPQLHSDALVGQTDVLRHRSEALHESSRNAARSAVRSGWSCAGVLDPTDLTAARQGVICGLSIAFPLMCASVDL